MAANSMGKVFRITTFGESHGSGLGVVIDGCPAGVQWQESLLLKEIERRRPGQKMEGRPVVVTDRNEGDIPEVLSGVHQGLTLGTPIALLVRNSDHRSDDYKGLAPRVGHADDVWKAKFGHSDHRGGGRASGRETVSRVMAGAVAQMFAVQTTTSLRVTGFTRAAGPFRLSDEELKSFDAKVMSPLGRPNGYPADAFVARFPSEDKQFELEKLLLDAKARGKSYGGTAEIWIDGCPKNLGQPVFHKLKSDLAMAALSLGATTAFELGAGKDAASAEGTQFHSQIGRAHV